MSQEESQARTLEKALTALLGDGASAREKVEKLYAFLDILDRKASSLYTINSLLLAVDGLLIFRPPPSIDTGNPLGMHFWAGRLLPLGFAAIVLSLLTVLYGVFVNSMNWPFLHNFQARGSPSSPTGPFNKEIEKLCEVVSERTRHVRIQRWATLLSIAATLVGVLMICFHTWVG